MRIFQKNFSLGLRMKKQKKKGLIISFQCPDLFSDLLEPQQNVTNSEFSQIGHVYSFGSCITSPPRNGHSRSETSSRLESFQLSEEWNNISGELGRRRRGRGRIGNVVLCFQTETEHSA